MPSKYTVAVVLDEESGAIWDSLPAGEKSKRVRKAISDAEIVERRDMLIEALRRQINNRERIISDIRLLCNCRAIKAYIDKAIDEGVI